MRRIPSLVAILAILVCAPKALAGAKISVGAEPFRSIARAYVIDGVIYLSVIEVMEALGFEGSWHAPAEKWMARKGDQVIAVMPGVAEIVSGDRRIRLENPPRYIGDTLCVPAEFVKRALPRLLELSPRLQDVDAAPPPAVPDLLAARYVLKRVVIDAGHGGHDTGARSPEGILEKDINLAIALKVRELLLRETDIEPILTRDSDFFVPLAGRTKIGNRAEADLFVSVHSNGSVNRAATGLETYFLSFEATDRQAARLAAEENAVVQFETDSPFAAFGEGDDLTAILRDMTNAENMRASERLAAAVQARMVQMLGLPNRGVKQAPFFVLVGSKIPAILVEVGFVSNPEEARKLASEETQWRLAGAIFQAVLHYDEVLASSGADAP